MPPSTVEITAWVAAGTAVPALVVLLARRRPAYRMSLGILLATAVAVTAALVPGGAMSQSLVVALGGPLVVAAFAAGLLNSLARAERLRHAVDATVAGACLFFVGWIVYVLATSGTGPKLGLNRDFLVVAGSAATAATMFGLASITAARAVRPRRAVLLASAGTSLVIGGLLTGALAGSLDAAVSPATTAAPLGLGFLLLAASGWSVRSGRGPERPVLVQRPQSTVYAFVGIAGVAAGCVFQILTYERYAPVSALTGCVICLGLVTRLSLALRDVEGFAERFRGLAFTDPLTGLPNRRALMALSEEEAPAERSLIAIDLDGFKNVNDLQGHEAGDVVLTEVGRRLRENIRDGDTAIRLGGDEFAVLTAAPPEAARPMAERLLGVLSQPYEIADGATFLSASMGLAGSDSAPTVEGLLRNADLALRYAKQSGKNRVELYDATYEGWLRRRITLEHGLRRAIERDELSLSYQPVVRLPDGAPVGVEALLRWHHPDLGVVPPDEFIPVAEEIGQIGALGTWAAHAACHQLSRWLGDGHDLWLALNVSVRELRVPGYAPTLMDILKLHRVPPDRLVVEVTEQSVAGDIEELSVTLRALREAGVRIALDDFGSGYSSLGRLRRLPVDVIKIDRALVVEPGLGVAPLVDVCVRLGERLGLQVVAEGVEDAAQRSVVEEAGCRLGQGYLFGRAMPAEHVEALLLAATVDGAATTGDSGPVGR